MPRYRDKLLESSLCNHASIHVHIPYSNLHDLHAEYVSVFFFVFFFVRQCQICSFIQERLMREGVVVHMQESYGDKCMHYSQYSGQSRLHPPQNHSSRWRCSLVNQTTHSAALHGCIASRAGNAIHPVLRREWSGSRD